MTSDGIVQKLWNYCNVLRDDGLSYGDYVEQLTFLLFLKSKLPRHPNCWEETCGSLYGLDHQFVPSSCGFNLLIRLLCQEPGQFVTNFLRVS
jgi:hypothetical protein